MIPVNPEAGHGNIIDSNASISVPIYGTGNFYRGTAGAANPVIFTLPLAANTGAAYYFYRGTQNTQVTAQGGEFINTPEGLAMASIRSDQADSVIRLISDGVGWSIISATGLWYNPAIPAQQYPPYPYHMPRTAVAAAAYTTAALDCIIAVTHTPIAAVTITLATAVVASGRYFHIVDEGGNAGTNNITVDTQAAELINGEASQVINDDWNSMSVYSDGTDWFVY